MDAEDAEAAEEVGVVDVVDKEEEEKEEEEKERVEVGLRVLGVEGMEVEWELKVELEDEMERGGEGRVGGLESDCWGGGGAGKDDGAGDGVEKDWAVKGEGEVGLCVCDAWSNCLRVCANELTERERDEPQ